MEFFLWSGIFGGNFWGFLAEPGIFGGWGFLGFLAKSGFEGGIDVETLMLEL